MCVLLACCELCPLTDCVHLTKAFSNIGWNDRPSVCVCVCVFGCACVCVCVCASPKFHCPLFTPKKMSNMRLQRSVGYTPTYFADMWGIHLLLKSWLSSE